MEPPQAASFFIAAKLRGIPLVTGGDRRLGRADEASGKRGNENFEAVSAAIEMQPVTTVPLIKTKLPITTTNKPNKSHKITTTTISTPIKKKPKPTTTTTTKRPPIQRSRVVPVSAASPSSANRQQQRTNGILAKALLHQGTGSRPSSDELQRQNTNSPVVSAISDAVPVARKLNLTSVQQSAFPGNQRRTQQSVIAPRFVNKPSERAAGEHWKLFNRTDSQLSLFEGLALAANVMIVSTIAIVILVNWVRALRRKRRPAAVKQHPQGVSVEQQQQQPSPSPLASSSGVKSPTDRLSRLLDGPSPASRSAVGSAASSATSNLASATGAKKNEDDQHPDRVGSSQRISSEVKGGMSVPNKAMAIVQPSENMDMRELDNLSRVSKDKADDGQVKKAEVQMHRAASDLSGVASQSRGKLVPGTKVCGDDANQKGAADKLDELFKGSTPNLVTDIPEPEAGSSKKKQDPLKAASSLDSVDLPNELVANIKQAENKDLNPNVPSPNLLLGEVEKPAKETSDQAGGKQPDAKPQCDTTKMKDDEPVDTGVNKPKKIEKRPENPMGREIADGLVATQAPSTKAAEVKSHQIVVNKLDKRKTNLEIVDLRDESVTGKMRAADGPSGSSDKPIEDQGWISMDGVAVVQAAPPAQLSAPNQAQQYAVSSTSGTQTVDQAMSPSEIIDSRFNVDYASQRRRASSMNRDGVNTKDSMDSKAEEQILNNIENELELNNDRLRNRKYFVYIVNDGHFTAKKECIARIELPPKRRITLAEMRQLITNSKDISLLSLRRNKFKFVTETYRLLNENEDATVLHQVYPTQGVFLKLNVSEPDSQAFTYKGRNRGSSNSNIGSNTLAQTTIASRRRANARSGSGENSLPAIEVEPADNPDFAPTRSRAASVGRKSVGQRQPVGNRSAGSYGRSKSSVQAGYSRGAANRQQISRRKLGNDDSLPSLGMSPKKTGPQQERQTTKRGSKPLFSAAEKQSPKQVAGASTENVSKLSSAATDLGANVLSGAKKLFNVLR